MSGAWRLGCVRWRAKQASTCRWGSAEEATLSITAEACSEKGDVIWCLRQKRHVPHNTGRMTVHTDDEGELSKARRYCMISWRAFVSWNEAMATQDHCH